MKTWVLHWRWSDGSQSGIVPLLFTDAEKAKICVVLDAVLVAGTKIVEWTEVSSDVTQYTGI